MAAVLTGGDEAALSSRAPRPEVNAWLTVGDRSFPVDCLWRAERLIVELDGRAVHGTATAFEADRERDRTS